MPDFKVVVKRTIVLTTELYLPAFNNEDATNVAREQMKNGELGRAASWVEDLPYIWTVEEENDAVVSIEEMVWNREGVWP